MKVVIESTGIKKGRIITGIALTPAVSLNRNIYSIEAIDSAKNLNTPLPADWEHTEEIVGNVTYEKGPNHSIIYTANITTERANEIKEGVHKVSIEASVDEVVNSCNRKGCYNLVDGITFEGIGITTNPGIQTTTLSIVESYQEWNPITNHLCESCVSDCLAKKVADGKDPTDPQNQAICYSECGESVKENEKMEQLEKEILELKSKVEYISKPKCVTCGKNKKTEKINSCSKCGKKVREEEDEDDTEWITVNGVHIPIKPGEDKQDKIDQVLSKGSSAGKDMGGGKKDYTKKDIDTAAKKIWDGYTQKQKVNHYSTYAGKTKPGQSHYINKVVGRMTFDALPKYARQGLKDDAEDVLKRK